MHGLQNALVTMLNRDIDIGKHFRRIANRSDKLIGHALGLQIENSNPYVQRTKRLGKCDEKLSEICRPIVLVLEILTPDTGILSDKDDFLNAAGDKLARLLAMMRSAGRVTDREYTE